MYDTNEGWMTMTLVHVYFPDSLNMYSPVGEVQLILNVLPILVLSMKQVYINEYQGAMKRGGH
jgi:hypothetical protein